MKKILVFFMLLLGPIMVVDATSISNIDMDIMVDMYGNATVVETWDVYVNQGTEGWHPYYNLGNSEISNLEVTMDGEEFTTISNWNVDSSFDEKAYKAGIYYPSNNEVDLCFGISSYGGHEYVIKYKISNFVSTVSDADMIYWNLFPSDFSAEPENVDITIYSDFEYEDTLDVWGYGKYGAPCYVYDGKIEMTSDDSRVTNDEYMTILVKFPKGTFQTNNILNHDFDYYYEMAEEGTIKYNDKHSDKTSFFDKFCDLFTLILGFIFCMFYFTPHIFGFFVSLISNFLDKLFSSDSFNKYELEFEDGRKIDKDIVAYRDIPCGGDIFKAYWLAGSYGLIKKKEDFLGVILLKWLEEGKVFIEKGEKKTFFRKKEVVNIVFSNNVKPFNVVVEKELYDYMYQASHDGILESEEFEKWCKSHYARIFKWFNRVIKYEINCLIQEGKIKVEERKGFLFSSKVVYVVDSSLTVEARQLAGLKKFLKEFTLINEREPIEVNLWNKYLIYAQMFGIADKVAKKFEKLYPEVIEDLNNNLFDFYDVRFINSIMHNGIKSAYSGKRYVEYKSTMKSIAESRASSYSSGGGGFSSGGGGGGSSGGGGGGGGFR